MPLLTSDKAAALIGVTVGRIHQARNLGQLAVAEYVGRTPLYRRADVIRLGKRKSGWPKGKKRNHAGDSKRVTVPE